MNVAESTSTSHVAPERRATPRTRLQKLAYIHVEPDNGVIVLDVSSGGIRFCAATALADTDVLRLQLSLQNNLRVAVTARLIWMDPTMKSGGLQFDALPAAGLERVVHDWLDYSGLPTHAGKTIAPPPPLPSIPILATIPPSPRAANVPAIKVLEPEVAKTVEAAAAPAAVVEAPVEVKVPVEGNAPAAKPVSPEKNAESAHDKESAITQIPAPSTILAVPPVLVADVPATKASEPPAAKAAPAEEAVAAQPLLRQPEKKQLAPPLAPAAAAIPAIPQPQAAPAAPAVADRASATSDSAPAVVKTPQPTAPPKTAVIVPHSRPATSALRKIPAPAPRPIVARANTSLAKKTKPKEFIGFAVAALLLIAILISLPAIFRNKPASSDALASASVANPNLQETPAAAPDANSQPVAPAQNPSRAYKPASASDLTAAEPKSPNVGSPAAPAGNKALNAASADSALAAKNAAAPSAKADASSDPAAARDLRASTPAAGFGAPVAVPLSGVSSAPRDAVRTGEFNSVSVNASQAVPNAGLAPAASALQPAVIFDKPSPAYTEEARKLAIEGEVTLEVIFSGSGQVQVLRVAKGLGHGLDESAVSAAQQIRFRPAMQNGQPVDFPATLHITFQLAF